MYSPLGISIRCITINCCRSGTYSNTNKDEPA
nr:MAG TPA: hypothetical protein [Caudoviricetes sp.]